MKKDEKKEGRYVREPGFKNLSTAERKEMEAYAKGYMDFLGKAKTERRAYAESVALIEKQGFRPLSSFKSLKPGDKVYRGYHGKTLLAAVIGREPIASMS